MVCTGHFSNLEDIKCQNSILLYQKPLQNREKKNAHRMASACRYLRYLSAEARRCAIVNTNKIKKKKSCPIPGSNPRHGHYKSKALTTRPTSSTVGDSGTNCITPLPPKIAMVCTGHFSNLEDIKCQNSILLNQKPLRNREKNAHRLASACRYMIYAPKPLPNLTSFLQSCSMTMYMNMTLSGGFSWSECDKRNLLY